MGSEPGHEIDDTGNAVPGPDFKICLGASAYGPEISLRTSGQWLGAVQRDKER